MLKFMVILLTVIFIAGCSGSGDSFSSLFSGSSGGSIGSGLAGGEGDGGSGGGDTPLTYYQPEPTTMAMFGIGLAGLAVARMLKKKKKKGL